MAEPSLEDIRVFPATVKVSNTLDYSVCVGLEDDLESLSYTACIALPCSGSTIVTADNASTKHNATCVCGSATANSKASITCDMHGIMWQTISADSCDAVVLDAKATAIVVFRVSTHINDRICKALQSLPHYKVAGEAAGNIYLRVWREKPQHSASPGAPLPPLPCEFYMPRLPFKNVDSGECAVKTELGNEQDGSKLKWNGAVIADDDSIIGVPNQAQHVLRYIPTFPPLDSMKVHRCLEKYIEKLKENGFFKEKFTADRRRKMMNIFLSGPILRMSAAERIENFVKKESVFVANPNCPCTEAHPGTALYEIFAGDALTRLEPDTIRRMETRSLLCCPSSNAQRSTSNEIGKEALKTSFFSKSLDAPGSKYWGGARAADGLIYCAPHDADQVLCINTCTNTLSLVGPQKTAGESWAGAIEWDGKVWCLPRKAKRLLLIDASGGKQDLAVVSQVGPDVSNCGVCGSWAEGVLVGSQVYLIPDTADRVLKVDLKTLEITAIGDSLEIKGLPDPDMRKWGRGALGKTGCIYCPPVAADCILKIDPNTDTVSMIEHAKIAQLAPNCTNKWSAAEANLYKNTLYFAPLDAQCVVAFQPLFGTLKATPVDTNLGRSNLFGSCILHPKSGTVYCIPLAATHAIEIVASIEPHDDTRMVLKKIPPSDSPDVLPYAVRDRSTDLFTPPPYWQLNNLDEDTAKLIDITEYVLHRFQSLVDLTCNTKTLGYGRDQSTPGTYSRLNVIKVSRVESSSVWRLYAAKRASTIAQLRKHTVKPIKTVCQQDWMKPEMDPAINELYLWHGTNSANVQTILMHGFDERVGALAGMYGAGVYFAEKCSKSDQYVKSKGTRYSLFLSRVILGMPYHTKEAMKNLRRPPTIQGTNGRPHDSVVATLPNKYREFIVYSNMQTYPEYLVEYERA